jgi:hypothetical protein
MDYFAPNITIIVPEVGNSILYELIISRLTENLVVKPEGKRPFGRHKRRTPVQTVLQLSKKETFPHKVNFDS